MKKGLLTVFGILCFLCSYAQDTLIKKNGDEVRVTILEITPELIKYKRFDYPEGPTISILKTEVFLVKYGNGTKEVISTSTNSATSFPSSGPEPLQSIKLGGPRIGFTFISGSLADELKREHNIQPFMTQFGWQYETRIFTTSRGLTSLVEFVPLIGGLEQGKFLPSLNALVGLRGTKGFEVGIGPNISLAGAGLVLAIGTNFQSEGINFPVNIAVVPGNDGVRFSLLFGFNSRKY